MVDDEVGVLQDALAAHRDTLLGALHSNHDLDIETAFQIHGALSRVLIHWDEFTAHQQREVVGAIEYVVNTHDEVNDLTGSHGFDDDLLRLRELQLRLGL